MKPEVKVWFELAIDDLDTAQKNLEISKYHIAALFAQQSAEKALKSLYIKMFNELKKTHDLLFLASKINIPENYKLICKQLNPVYLQARYPDASGQLPAQMFNQDDAKEFIKISKEILEWVEQKIF